MISLFFLIILGALIYYGISKYNLHFTQKVIIPAKLFIFLSTIVLGFNLFLFESHPGIGWSLFFTIFFGFFFTLFPKEKRGFFVYFLSLTGIIASLALMGRANDFMADINVSTIFFSTAFLIILHSVEDAEKHIFAFIRGAWATFFGLFRQFGNLYTFAQTHKEKGKFNILQVLKTSAITVVIIVVFVSLLSQADPVFAQIMEDFFGNIEARFLASLIIIALVTLGFTISIKANKPINAKLSFLNYYDFIIPLTVLITLLGVFLAIQFTYLFGGQADLVAFDLTFSEYVRKGFIELLIATFFGLLISVLILFKEDHLKTKENKVLKIVHFILLIELLLMLVSAFKRDIIYIDSYGLTRIRVLGGIFLIWLAGIFTLITSANFIKKFPKKQILVGAGGFGLFFFLVLNIANTDQFIVDYNTNNFAEKNDIFYNSLLSEDAIKGWEEAILISQTTYNNLSNKKHLTDLEKKELAETLLALKSITEKRNKLFDYYGTLEEVKDNDYTDIPKGFPDHIKYNRKWQSMNLGKKQAFEFVKENSETFDKTLNCLNQNIDFYQIKNSIDISEETNTRLREYDYPFTERFYYYNDIDSVKRDIFRYFLNHYVDNSDFEKKYYQEIDYLENLETILTKIKSRMNINSDDLDDYQKENQYYEEFERYLVELIEVEKCN